MFDLGIIIRIIDLSSFLRVNILLPHIKRKNILTVQFNSLLCPLCNYGHIYSHILKTQYNAMIFKFPCSLLFISSDDLAYLKVYISIGNKLL